MSEVWKALGFMSLGMLIAEVYNMRAWRRYREGRAEGAEYRGARRYDR